MNQIPRILARLSPVLLLALSACGSPDDERVAERTAIATSTHPLAGFWKQSTCADRFGLAIAPAGDQYSVSFCGPGGCFEPGTYRPNTKIVDDPAYRVIDNDTIEVGGKDGFTKYVRCAAR
ncbi:MAG: hypothetical protein U1F26_07235 [Lysobacterales bacterium]